MKPAVRAGASGLAVCLALMAGSASAGTARQPIRGKLTKPGYTVIALAANGRATSVRPGTSFFRLRAPAATVTLHLRARNGTYAGPVVVGRKGSRALVGVRAGARLGRILVHPGYARLARKLSARWIDPRRSARARNGVPIGARRFGRVVSRRPHAQVAGDRDVDGIPDALDIDDDGDLILDNQDHATGARAAQAGGNKIYLWSAQVRFIDGTVNANAAPPGSPLTTEQIDASLAATGHLGLSLVPTAPGGSRELDCGGSRNPTAPPPWLGGLSYCTPGGTGTVFNEQRPPFPDCCDADGDGWGTVDPQGGGLPADVFFLGHRATTAQMKTGDVLIERVSDAAGVETAAFPATLQFVVATVPALVSYSDTAGHSATVSYPVSGPGPPGVGGMGADGNGFPVSAGADGDIVLTLSFWRPQRTPIAGETGAWTDIGHLTYVAGLLDLPLLQVCPQAAYTTADPKLAPAAPSPGLNGGGLSDSADDAPADPANTFSYKLNLTRCLAAYGASFDPGQQRALFFTGRTPTGDITQQNVFFTRQ